MSWTLELIRTKTNTEPYGQENENDVVPFSREEIINAIRSISPDIIIDDNEKNYVHISCEKLFVYIGVWFWEKCVFPENSDSYYVVELEVRGYTEPKEFLYMLTQKLNARLFDMSAGKFWTGDGEGFAEWKNLCKKIAEELSGEKN